ncbi:hypothetical protein [Marinomonas sp. 2405UD68-3]|uniref:hypothetical protein n=1 Tax=Marinomonas sp. 2405UD68-3 TaxID=3391835 RepID=UPI0039C94E25
MVIFVAEGAAQLIQFLGVFLALSGLSKIIFALYRTATSAQLDPNKPLMTEIFQGVMRISLFSIVYMLNEGGEYAYHPLYIFSRAVVKNLSSVTSYIWLAFAIIVLVCLLSMVLIVHREKSVSLGAILRIVIFVGIIEGINTLYSYVFM